jgi:hypothetical protein
MALNKELAKIHTFLDKHEPVMREHSWATGFDVAWCHCETCHSVWVESQHKPGKKIPPERVLPPWNKSFHSVPKQFRKILAEYFYEIGWHLVDGKPNQELLDILNIEMDLFNTIRIK